MVMEMKMKKFIVLLLAIFLLSVTSVFAQKSQDSSYYQLEMMLNKSKNLDDSQYYQISSMASGLSSAQRGTLFESHKKSPTVPFIVNFLVGFGIGSYIQGDAKGGTIALLGDLLSTGLIVGGYTVSLYTIFTGMSGEMNVGEGLMTAGAIGLVATRLFESIRPFSFASNYNKKLSNTLMSFSMVPLVDAHNDMQMRLAATITF